MRKILFFNKVGINTKKKEVIHNYGLEWMVHAYRTLTVRRLGGPTIKLHKQP